MIADDRRRTLRLTPQGHLVLDVAEDAPELEAATADRIVRAFARGQGQGLFRLGAAEVGTVLSPVFAYWRELGARLVTALCTRPAGEGRVEPPPPPADDDLAVLAAAAPLMPGAEYVTAEVLRALWCEMGDALVTELRDSGASLQDFLRSLSPAWNLVGRVHFNLAENRRDEDAPFAFLATYTSRLSAHGKAQHLPLGQALREYVGAANKERLLSLLLPVQRAAERCSWLRQMVDAGEIFHPLRWTPQEAFRFLGDVHSLEQAGEPGDCAISHHNLAICLKRSSGAPEVALAHGLAAGVRFESLFARLPKRFPSGDAALHALWDMALAEQRRRQGPR